MCISAYIAAGRVLDMPQVRAFAQKSLDRVLTQGWNRSLGLAHVIAYGEQVPIAVRVSGMLDDYVFVAHACLDVWECTGEIRYYEAAAEITESMVARFHDPVGGGFFDTQPPIEGEKVLGALSARRKPLQDTPTPAGNPVAAALLLRMEALSGRADYTVKAEDTMESFSGVVEHFGLYAGTFGLAMQRMVQSPVQVCVIGEDADARALEAVAMARFAVNKSVIRLRRDQLRALPPMLAETLPHLPELATGRSCAVVCTGNTCLPPVTAIEDLMAALNQAL